MGAEVKLTMAASDHMLLHTLLKFWAGKITEEQLVATLVTLGYRREPLETERFGQVIAGFAERLAAQLE